MTLKEIRKSKRITQNQLSKVLMLNRTTISKWESGKSKPDILVCYELANFFNMEIKEITDCFKK